MYSGANVEKRLLKNKYTRPNALYPMHSTRRALHGGWWDEMMRDAFWRKVIIDWASFIRGWVADNSRSQTNRKIYSIKGYGENFNDISMSYQRPAWLNAHCLVLLIKEIHMVFVRLKKKDLKFNVVKGVTQIMPCIRPCSITWASIP